MYSYDIETNSIIGKSCDIKFIFRSTRENIFSEQFVFHVIKTFYTYATTTSFISIHRFCCHMNDSFSSFFQICVQFLPSCFYDKLSLFPWLLFHNFFFYMANKIQFTDTKNKSKDCRYTGKL